MQRKKALYIGTSDYKDLIQQNGYFVDKTLLIKEFIDRPFKVSLIPRPRRFGKTLNLSMLKYYFDITEKDAATLFEPFEIWQAGDYYRSFLGKFPVIHITLKGGKATTFEKSQQDIFNILAKTYIQFKWLLDTDVLHKEEKDSFLAVITGEANKTTYETSIKNLTEYLNRYYGQQTLILIDEYDAPIHAGFQYGFYDKIVELMKSFLGETLKDNKYLYKGLVTGILRIAKESIFSDFNNPGIFTILSSAYEGRFGFTQKEVAQLLDYYQLSDHYKEIKVWYDGYKFGRIDHIYNPWSIINYINLYQDGFKPYWVNTSSDYLIKSRIIEKEAYDVRTAIEALMQGKTVEREIEEHIVFSDFERDREILWSLLFFCGYLKPAKKTGRKDYKLKIPNQEISTLFQDIVVEWFKTELKVNYRTLKAMGNSLRKNHTKKFEQYFKKIMQDTFSYFDVNTEPERVYQAYVLGLLGIMSDDYIIKSNRESGQGRYDILLLPRNHNDYGIIMEIKTLDKGASDARIAAELSDALKQIQKNKYQKELQTQGVQNKVEMAMVFVGKEVKLAVG